MIDPRITTLAKNLINYSCALKEGEKVLIEVVGNHMDLATELVKQAYAAKALPYTNIIEPKLLRAMHMGSSEAQWDLASKWDTLRMSEMNAYIGLRGGDNTAEYADVPQANMDYYMKHYYKPVHFGIRIPKTKWVVLRYPAPSMAQSANMSTEAFEDFYFSVCNLDYAKMSKAMDPLVELINKTDKVRITGRGTDLSFSIKGLPAIKCDGDRNIPDGEVYTAPVKDSIEGTISYNTPSREEGFVYENIVFKFKKGKIVEATSNDNERINKYLDTDEGARYIGEFSFGINPLIKKPMMDTLFDEKICGSIHLTPGNAYDECDNGNKSAVHWDLVFIQTPEYGGGEIYFDGRLIRKDGIFVAPELLSMNAENLL